MHDAESRRLPARAAAGAEPAAGAARARLLYVLLALVGALLAWASLGKLDIVAVADGKLVPASYLKIVQPRSRA